MPFAEASPGHAQAIAKRLRHYIRMHVTMRVAHIGIWVWLLARALAVLNCAWVHAYAVRSARIRDQSCLPSVERMRAEPSLFGALHVGAGLGDIAEVYERASGDTIASCVICSTLQVRTKVAAKCCRGEGMAAFGKIHGAGAHNFADGPLRNGLCPHNAYLLSLIHI